MMGMTCDCPASMLGTLDACDGVEILIGAVVITGVPEEIHVHILYTLRVQYC